ncbi:hypothetical protein PSHT_15474 [Puccinia striiformis]|uniref:Uncharacterized protein n=1 Tax=Puccinia striiformis TaxID=27350 RepID=A0A2S4UEQ7_9BASI|nr:hypothetical protein PSHT_15474 [Puccinia striiformis]
MLDSLDITQIRDKYSAGMYALQTEPLKMDGARNKILISYALDPQNESDRMHQLQLQFKKSSDVVVLKELIKPIFVEVSKIRARLERKRSDSPMGCITPSKEVSDMGLSLQIYEPHSPCYILTDLFTHGYIQNMKSLHLKFFPSSMRIVLMLGVALAAKYHSIPCHFVSNQVLVVSWKQKPNAVHNPHWVTG